MDHKINNNKKFIIIIWNTNKVREIYTSPFKNLLATNLEYHLSIKMKGEIMKMIFHMNLINKSLIYRIVHLRINSKDSLKL